MTVLSWLDKLILDNSEELLIGIIASLIVLSLQVAVRSVAGTITYFATSRLLLLRLFAFREKSNIYVVSGSIPWDAKSKLAYLAGPDATASSNVLQSLKTVYQEAFIRHHYATRYACRNGVCRNGVRS